MRGLRGTGAGAVARRTDAGGSALLLLRGGGTARRGRAGDGAHLVPLVRAGARFERGILVDQYQEVAA